MILLYFLYSSKFVFLFSISYKFSTFIWKFYHVINKSATVYPRIDAMFHAVPPIMHPKGLQSQAHHSKNTKDHIHIRCDHGIQDQPVICCCPHYLLIFKGKQKNRK